MSTPNIKMFTLFKANFPMPKGTGNIVRGPPDSTEIEYTPDIHIRCSAHDRKNTK